MSILTWAAFLTMTAACEPVTFTFVRGSGPEGKRERAYDARGGQYLLRVEDIARFRVSAVTQDLASLPVVLRISGMIERPEGPLTLHVDGKQYPLYHDKFDAACFRVHRRDGVTTIEFLPKGKALLKAGATFEYIDLYRG